MREKVNEKEYKQILENIANEIKEKETIIKNIENRIIHNGNDDMITTNNEEDFKQREILREEIRDLNKKKVDWIQQKFKLIDE